MNPILITGAFGFVGRHLITRLLRESSQHKVVAAALPSELQAAAEWTSALSPAAQRRLAWQALDINNPEMVRAVLVTSKPGAIVHLAARASGADPDREAVHRTNVVAVGTLLQEVRRTSDHLGSPVKTLLISTGYAYGSSSIDRPSVESDPLEYGRYGPYTDSKIEMERVAAEFADIVVIARSFSHTGPEQTPVFAVPSFARQIAMIERGALERDISVGNLDPLRDMLDVRDVVRAYELLIEHGALGETYNVSSSQPLSMRDILDRLRSMSSVPTTVSSDPERFRPADIGCSTGSYEKLQTATGWQPAYDINTTLADTLRWWQSSLDIPDPAKGIPAS